MSLTRSVVFRARCADRAALDLLELLQISKDRPHHIYAFLAFTHLYQDGCPVLGSIDDALSMDAALIIEIGKRCEQLYEEGRDW